MSCANSNWLQKLRLGVIALLALIWPGGAGAAPTDHHVKAVFMFNFAQFVEWPSRAFTNESSPLVIGIVGEDPFGPILDQAVKDEVARGRKIIIHRFSPDENPADCQVLFISRSEADRVGALLQSLKGLPILTVSEVDKFCEQGGMINFVRQDQNVRLEINRPATEAAGLKINARLLGLARLVKTETLKESTP
jgi:hypothetical protein